MQPTISCSGLMHFSNSKEQAEVGTVAFQIAEGETQDFDLDGDGTNDLSLTLVSADGGTQMATLDLTALQAPSPEVPPEVPPEQPPGEAPPGEAPPEEEEVDNTMLYAGIIIVIVILGGAYLFFTKK